MEDFANILHRDYGLKPQGKSAPMSASKPSPSAPPLPASAPIHRSSSSSSVLPKNGSTRSSSAAILGEDDLFFGASSLKSSSGRNTFGSGGADLLGGSSVVYDDVFGGPPKFVPPSYPAQAQSSPGFEDLFRMPLKTSTSSNKGSSLPVFDAPVYDDDIFGGVPGIRSADVAYDDVFSGGSTSGPTPAVFDDLLGGFGTSGSKERTTDTAADSAKPSAGESAFDELLPGFGGTEPAKPRSTADAKPSQRKSSWTVDDSSATTANDPFVVLDSNRVDSSPPVAPVPDLDPFGISSRPPGGNGKNNFGNGSMEGTTRFESSPSPGSAVPGASNKSVNTLRDSGRRKDTVSPTPSPTRINASRESADGNSLRKNSVNSNHVKDQMKTSSTNRKPEPDVSVSSAEAASTESPSRRSRQVAREASESPHHYRQEDPKQLPRAVKSKRVDEFWVTIEDVKLVTQPTAAPPPSRPPPAPISKQGYARKPVDRKITGNQDFNDISAESATSKMSQNNSGSVFDELEEFAAGGSKVRKDEKGDAAVATPEDDEMEVSAAATASAVAMKEAMERAEAKLRLAKEAKDREKEERAARVREEREKSREARERGEEKTREQEEDREAKSTRESDEREREEKEREARERRRKEKEREREREREKDRIAVERATQEARERAAADARERAEKIAAENREKAQRAAVERATAEARERAAVDARERAERAAAERERAERAAVERATAEARERAAADARERAAERAAVERAASEARARAERAAVERANAEARERLAGKAAAEAREREEKAAAERSAATREQQRRNENDLESFFMSNSRPTSVPRQRSPATDVASDQRQSSKGFSSEGQRRSSTVAPTPSAGKGPSVTSMGDDWTSLFSAPSASGEFQEVEGESEERRRARWERHMRTRERAAKALEEKNQRDLKGQMEQAERHRVGEVVDAEIKRWAAGKEGNLRALLSTLQYVLWPECGWQTVSLTDLITAASVKKVYRKATLCVHPDKVQQKGATIQQKYIAEKVFDLLKEAWNKFNSEELF